MSALINEKPRDPGEGTRGLATNQLGRSLLRSFYRTQQLPSSLTLKAPESYLNTLAMIEFCHRYTGFPPDNVIGNPGRLIPIFPSEEGNRVYGWLIFHYDGSGGVYGVILYFPYAEYMKFCIRGCELVSHLTLPDIHLKQIRLDCVRLKGQGWQINRFFPAPVQGPPRRSGRAAAAHTLDYTIIADKQGSLCICQSRDGALRISRLKKYGVWQVSDSDRLLHVVQLARKQDEHRQIYLIPGDRDWSEQAARAARTSSKIHVKTIKRGQDG